MTDLKLVLSDPKTGKAYNIEAKDAAAAALIGKSIGTEIDANVFGLPGYKITITGGSDKTGTPARADLPGNGKRGLLITEGFGFNPKKEGERRRKTQRGCEIASDFVQVNAKVTVYGAKSLEETFGAAPAEEPKQE
ncbi:MAG TPA: 30S ribosomal protein S6e [Methanocorpusculum sp.]|nr:30S ribosomal protein S6e [Methanocorpusculum sp.]